MVINNNKALMGKEGDEMVFIDKYGWPVEKIKGKPITTFIRLLIHTRKIKKGYWDGYRVRKSS